MYRLSRTDGNYSRVRKLNDEQVAAIREEYNQGLRGKDRAAHYGISASHFNRLGRARDLWKGVFGDS